MKKIRKVIMILIVYISLAFFTVFNASTSDLEAYSGVKDNGGKYTCAQILGDPNTKGSLMNILRDIYGIMRVAAVILVIVTGMIDFTKAVAASDSDKLNKSLKSFVTKLIVLIVFFLVPGFINIIWELVFGEGTACVF